MEGIEGRYVGFYGCLMVYRFKQSAPGLPEEALQLTTSPHLLGNRHLPIRGSGTQAATEVNNHTPHRCRGGETMQPQQDYGVVVVYAVAECKSSRPERRCPRVGCPEYPLRGARMPWKLHPSDQCSTVPPPS